MSRSQALQLIPSGHRDLVKRLMKLHQEATKARMTALEKARDAGQILLGFDRQPRALILREAGISERTGYIYCQIAENWHLLEDRIAASLQRAAKPLSLRGALGEIKRGERKTKIERYDLQLDHVADAKQLKKIIAGIDGRNVSVEVVFERKLAASELKEVLTTLRGKPVRMRIVAEQNVPKRERQPELPFD